MMPTLSVLPSAVRTYPAREEAARVSLSVMSDIALLPEQERKARVAYVIRTARERRGLTPPQLAEKVGRGRGTVNDWEAGRSTPSLVDLGPLCVALGLEPRAFAELPAIPEDPILAFLLPAADSGVEEGVRRARRRPSVPGPDTRAPSRGRPTRGTGEEPG